MTKQQKQWALAGMAFLAAWQATGFALDYRAILGAVLAAGAGYTAPKQKPTA